MKFIDVESSGLEAETYPIQIAWYENDDEYDSFYIKPMESWIYARPWNQESEAIHNIPLTLLLDVGVDPVDACGRLNDKLKGQTVYCDAPSYDSRWIDVMFNDCNIERNFDIEHVRSAVPPKLSGILFRELRMAPENPHDALEDATLLSQIVDRVVNKK